MELGLLQVQGLIIAKLNNKALNDFEIANFQISNIEKVTGAQNLAVGSLSLSTTMAVPFSLDKVLVSFSGAVTQTVQTLYVDSNGVEYLLDSQSLVAAQVYLYQPTVPIRVTELDNIKVTCTNATAPAVTATANIFVLEA